MDELNSEQQESLEEETQEELVELSEEESVGEELKGKKIITMMIMAVAVINIVVLAIYWNTSVVPDIARLTLSIVVLVEIVLLRL